MTNSVKSLKNILILHTPVSNNSAVDEMDVLSQVELISHSLANRGVHIDIQAFGEHITGSLLKGYDFVFNLVETVNGKGELSFLIPALLESHNITFSGSGSKAMMLTTDKVLAKISMLHYGIPTPHWATDIKHLKPGSKYIVKPINEDGSVGIEGEPVRDWNKIDSIEASWFAEEYIHGREFNLSVLAGEVLPPAEMVFNNFAPDRIRILDYKSKWDENSFEYKNTTRSFEIKEKELVLITEMKRISLACWNIFGLKGYARIDFRIDENNEPFVIEINANPCISPDSGFIAASKQAGYSTIETLNKIINDSNR
jgi:D-alanine-D-alanine ligase